MIENYNESKAPSNGDFVDVKKYIGVASLNILAVNPNNDKLRKYGWAISDGQPEPNYVITKQDENGNTVTNARLRFLAQIQDLDDKPIVALDFWCRPEVMVSKEKVDANGNTIPARCKIIDSYGRTAWGTKQEITARQIPQYTSGAASISTPYKPCHSGEEELVKFLFKYLNITPFQIFDRTKNSWVLSKNPGRLTIDDWASICTADVKEIAEYLALQPNNCVKVILGLNTTADNKTYQTFLNTTYIGNGALPDRNTGEYVSARKAIDKFFADDRDRRARRNDYSESPYSFSAAPVKEWKETATAVVDNSGKMFDDDGNFNENAVSTVEVDEDLPF